MTPITYKDGKIVLGEPKKAPEKAPKKEKKEPEKSGEEEASSEASPAPIANQQVPKQGTCLCCGEDRLLTRTIYTLEGTDYMCERCYSAQFQKGPLFTTTSLRDTWKKYSTKKEEKKE